MYKPLFSKKFEVFTIRNTFINKVSKLTLASCKDDLDEYFCQINDKLEAQQDRFMLPTITYPAEPVISDKISELYTGVIKKNCEDIFDALKVECFINGLSTRDFDRLKNKVNMTTAIKMFEFLDRDRQFKVASAAANVA